MAGTSNGALIGDRYLSNSCEWFPVCFKNPLISLQAHATSLDEAQLSQVLTDDPRNQILLGNVVNGRYEAFRQDGGWASLPSKDATLIAHLLCRFKVLDRIVNAVSFPRHPNLHHIPRVAFPKSLPEPLVRVGVESLTDSDIC
jgi:hypothetical protein